MIIEWIQECNSCDGTGLYVGVAEQDGAAVVCEGCQGTGRQHVRREYKEFKGRKPRLGVKQVYASGCGFTISPCTAKGGIPLEQWTKRPMAVHDRGAELRELVCPAWWSQGVAKDKPEWSECAQVLGGRFSNCKHFPEKSHCWKRWDGEVSLPLTRKSLRNR